jgi:hypothetical protein
MLSISYRLPKDNPHYRCPSSHPQLVTTGQQTIGDPSPKEMPQHRPDPDHGERDGRVPHRHPVGLDEEGGDCLMCRRRFCPR